MTQTNKITGMTCSGCQAKVKQIISALPGVKEVRVDLEKGEASFRADHLVPAKAIADAFKDHPKYRLAAIDFNEGVLGSETSAPQSWLSIYKPLLLIFGFLGAITILLELVTGNFLLPRWMQHFMAGFFLVFSFFKMLDLDGFADSYSTYDIVAKRWRSWAYVYAFIELFLGMAFLTGIFPVLVNATTFLVMSISMVGVLQAVLKKRKIRCACLGAVFNLPMSTITIFEDALMIGLSLAMLFHLTTG